jgi:DNA-binding winged helix-turn-helix (wHTH) protein/TolB-like protein
MSEELKHFYDFGPYRLDTVKRLLLKDSKPVPLTPKAFDTLLVLVQGSGQVLEKEELIKRVWPNSFVEDGNLTVNISMLRKALGETPNQHRYIVTVPGRGYRFVASVSEVWDQSASLIVEEHTRSHIVIEEAEAESENLAGINLVTLPSNNSVTALHRWRMSRSLAALSLLSLVLVVTALYLWRSARANRVEDEVMLKSIAVLPFKMLSSDADEGYLSFGMADTLITRLSAVRQIVVRSTRTVQKYSDLGKDSIGAGQELKVEGVIDGSIQKIGDRIRVNVNILSVSDGRSIWTKSFDGSFSSIFSLQDSISNELVGALGLTLSGEEKQRLDKRYTSNPEAYQLYMQGRVHWNRRSPSEVRQGIKYFQQAIEKDPSYALAYAGLADSYAILGGATGHYDAQARAAITQARDSAIEALKLDSTLAEAHASMAFIYLTYDWNWASAEREFKLAIELDPDYATAHHWYVFYLYAMGRLDEALDESNRAFQLEPIALMSGDVARSLFFLRRYDEAIEQCRKTLEMPDSSEVLFILGSIYERQGKYDEAIKTYKDLVSLTDGSLNAISSLGYAYAASGNTAEAMRILEDLKDRAAREYVAASYFAHIYAGLGDRDQTIRWLDKAYEEHLDILTYLKVDPKFDNLRDDPRFAALLRRMNLEQ